MFDLFKTPKGMKNAKKRKKRKIILLTGMFLIIVQIISMILFLQKMFQLDMLPLKYMAMLISVLILITLYNFVSQYSKAHMIGKILAVLLSVMLVTGYLYAAKLSATLNEITGTTTQTDTVDIIVLSSDKANSVSDAKSYTFGYNSTVNSSVITKALSEIETDNHVTISKKEYTSWDTLINSLYANKEIKAMAVTESVRATLADQYPDFSSRTKVIGSVKVTTEVKLNASDKKVNQEPFIIYLSGNDDYGEVASTGRSDVNILAVINPKTRQILLVSTPRDSYIKISNGNGVSGLDKLTHAGNAGVEYSVSALENLYGLSVDYYVKLNFTGCVNIVNALGGITINSGVDFTNGRDAAPKNYHFVIGPNECDGEKTLAFVRERHVFDNGDFQRGKNQEAGIKAIIDKVTSPSILANYSSVLDATSSMFLTNMPSGTITSLIKGQISNPTSWNVQQYSVGGTTGTRTGQVYGLSGMSVVMLDENTVNTAIELIGKVTSGETFSVDEYATQPKK